MERSPAATLEGPVSGEAIMDVEARQGFLGASGVGVTTPVMVVGWRAGSEVSTMRRRTVVRLAATLMYAGRDRMSGIRRKLPLTSFASAQPRHSAAGDRSCNGGSPAHRGGLGHPASQPE